VAAESYYARRAARDPAWHQQQLAGAREREAACRAADPEGFRERHAEAASEAVPGMRRPG
jgi:hypothetical protein